MNLNIIIKMILSNYYLIKLKMKIILIKDKIKWQIHSKKKQNIQVGLNQGNDKMIHHVEKEIDHKQYKMQDSK